MDKRIPVGVLGATGTVGQRFVQLLDAHPSLYVAAVGASERSAGRRYADAARWLLDSPIPPAVANLTVSRCDPANFTHCRIIFSGLDASVAGDVELAFMRADLAVFSNAKNHRLDPAVPLVVPLVNADHLNLIHHQRAMHRLSSGFLVTNANCSTTGLVVALKPLQDAFGPLARIVVTTMQAISGAGYPGVASLDILGNIVPYISGEEEKIEVEAAKILGTLADDATSITPTQTAVSASCNRVPVVDGHTASVFVEFVRKPQPSPAEVEAVLASYVCEAQRLKVPSAPAHAIVIASAPDRPQPRLDLRVGNGNSVVVGRVRHCPIFGTKFTILSHNTVLGAAGSSIMNAEIAVAMGLISQ